MTIPPRLSAPATTSAATSQAPALQRRLRSCFSTAIGGRTMWTEYGGRTLTGLGMERPNRASLPSFPMTQLLRP
jgi:hypothetical protein